MVTVLSRQSDPELLAAAEPALESLLTRQPESPGVLAAAVQYHESTGHSRLAVDARRRLANLKGYEDDSRKQEAALWLGNSLLRENPDLAAAYLWNAMTWWYNSGNGGDLGRRVTKALDEMRNTRERARQGPSGGMPGRARRPAGKQLGRQPFRQILGRTQPHGFRSLIAHSAQITRELTMFHLCVICHRTARRSIALASAGLLACSMIAIQTYGQELDRALDAPERAAVIDGLLAKVLKIYVLPDVAQQMERAIRDRQANKEYDTVSSGQELARVLTRHLRDVSKDDHLRVDFFARGIPYDSEKKPDPKVVEEFRQGGLRRNYEFKKVERLEGGIGLLQVDGFYPAEWITETAAGAMAFLANSESIILDLRQNSGGQSGGGLLCSYFFKEETHLTDFYNRQENTTRQIWSYPVAGADKFADKDLYILTSRQTLSAAEALAYDMQALKRARIVGEPTPGGAHGTTIYRITDCFSASIPFCRSINPVTKTDGGGVKPDVAVPADQALLTAHLLALEESAHEIRRHA